jgi:uncharacterized SAM-binding protein YcdF (DUF218 family)
MLNELSALKPLIAALLLPPGGLLLTAAGAWGLRRRHPRTAATLFGTALVGLWLAHCAGSARWLQDRVLQPPAALSLRQVEALAAGAGQVRAARTAIVVLGGGREERATEYGRGMLSPTGLARLHYGVWLAQHTHQPLAYAGGIGWGEDGAVSEAEVAAAIVQELTGQRPRWMDGSSRDTRENARNILPPLQRDGVRRIVLVTHAAHLPRALRWFRAAAQERGLDIELIPAPTGFVGDDEAGAMAWMPTGRGAQLVHAALHEIAGQLLAP